jgi:hypothetical protein
MADVSAAVLTIAADTTALQRAIREATRVCRRFLNERPTKAQRKQYKARVKNVRQIAERMPVTVVGP